MQITQYASCIYVYYSRHSNATPHISSNERVFNKKHTLFWHVLGSDYARPTDASTTENRPRLVNNSTNKRPLTPISLPSSLLKVHTGVQILVGWKFHMSRNVQTGPGVIQSSFQWMPASSPGILWPRRDDHSNPSTPEVQNLPLCLRRRCGTHSPLLEGRIMHVSSQITNIRTVCPCFWIS